MTIRSGLYLGMLCTALTTAVGCDSNPRSTPRASAPPTTQQLAGRLASADGRSGDQAAATQYQEALSSLAGKYPESHGEIVNMTLRAQEILREGGNQETALNIMQGIDAASGRNSGGQGYSQHVATYLALRNDRGLPHGQAIANLREFLGGIGNR